MKIFAYHSYFEYTERISRGITMSKKVVLLDMDDTVVNFLDGLWECNYNLYGEKIKTEEVVDWDLSKFSSRGKAVYDLFKYPGLFRNLSPKEGAYDFVENIDKDYELFFVTDSPIGTSHCDFVDSKNNRLFSNPTDDKRKWLEEHFPFFDSSKIIICKHKWMIEGDVILDDKLETYLAFKEKNRNALLMDAPHNRSFQSIDRVKDLKEAENKIRSLLD